MTDNKFLKEKDTDYSVVLGKTRYQSNATSNASTQLLGRERFTDFNRTVDRSVTLNSVATRLGGQFVEDTDASMPLVQTFKHFL